MSWEADWRTKAWNDLGRPWDVIVLGGGIMGAGILREAVRCGVRVLLLEQNDFASGTSSRSSKLVHGGLRYLKTGQWHLTLESVRERELLLRQGAGLVEPLPFVMPLYSKQRPAGWMLRLGLIAYDLMARRLYHRAVGTSELRMLAPHIREHDLVGAFVYPDAQTDDARLTLRVIQEALAENRSAVALNYVRAEGLLRDKGRVSGVRVRDRLTGAETEARATVVINATGTWADDMRVHVGGARKLRPLRGSHLIFPFHRIPVAQAVTLFHPADRRPIFIFPWEGAVVAGTTDLDHSEGLDGEPKMRPAEAAYIMQAVNHQFPSLALKLEDATACYCGVRPVIAGGHKDPSKESREFALWDEEGLLTIMGGKLTTFRVTARQVLRAAANRVPELGMKRADDQVLDEVESPFEYPLPRAVVRRLFGRHGRNATRMLTDAAPADLQTVGNSPYLWVELKWAARNEAVAHLQDLLLRRTRIGFVMRDGGAALLPKIRSACQALLGWDDARWVQEESDYLRVWQDAYCPPKIA